MPGGVRRSYILAVVGVALFALCYHLSSSPQHRYNVRLNQDGRELSLELSEAELEDFLKNNAQKTKSEAKPTSTTTSPKPQARNTSQGDDVEFVVVNNKVYLKGEPIPQIVRYPVLKPTKGRVLKNMDFSRFKGEEKKFMEARRKELLRRASRVSSMCKARSKLATSRLLHLIWDLKHQPNVVWCPNYKVASTSWMVNYLRLAHFNEDNPEILKLPPEKREQMRLTVKYGARQKKVFELYPAPSDGAYLKEAFEGAVRVMFVRHPFARILSAYRDKMSKMDPKPREYHFRDLQLTIISKYRHADSPETSPFPTFPEFVQHIIDSTKGYQTAEDWVDHVKCWTPYWAQCNVCSSDYTLILKLETMQEDERFLITLANYEELKKRQTQEWRHLKNATSQDLASQYYSLLTHEQILQLHQRYLLDFQLFEYTIDDYLKYANDR
ncbi:carbohydrate sulfotransferase 11-like [Penaeus indicus]|uniref:carbohydrate sulfotransferase 11-like n=1 Tax=Penaeus indicus TaxID=29960 RepID=UPI00300D896C